MESGLADVTYEPEDFGKKLDFELEYLTKLKATLTPEQMKEDLVLEQAADDEPHGLRVYQW